jgi:hypothetical protein
LAIRRHRRDWRVRGDAIAGLRTRPRSTAAAGNHATRDSHVSHSGHPIHGFERQHCNAATRARGARHGGRPVSSFSCQTVWGARGTTGPTKHTAPLEIEGFDRNIANWSRTSACGVSQATSFGCSDRNSNSSSLDGAKGAVSQRRVCWRLYLHQTHQCCFLVKFPMSASEGYTQPIWCVLYISKPRVVADQTCRRLR